MTRVYALAPGEAEQGRSHLRVADGGDTGGPESDPPVREPEPKEPPRRDPARRKGPVGDPDPGESKVELPPDPERRR